MGICVSDLERSVRFYGEVLGFRLVGRLDLKGQPTAKLNGMADVDVRTVYLERVGWRLELIQFVDPESTGSGRAKPMNELGFTHLAFRVDDLDEACSRVEAAGGGLLAETRLDLPGPTRVIMAHDPDGVRLELLEKDGDPTELPLGAGSGRHDGPTS